LELKLATRKLQILQKADQKANQQANQEPTYKKFDPLGKSLNVNDSSIIDSTESSTNNDDLGVG
jgi:hypothetical protein